VIHTGNYRTENWVTMKIPALGNLTPVEASRTEKGREMLKEVLRQIENELATVLANRYFGKTYHARSMFPSS
jgi:Protein of unknown function (DUF2384)